MSVSAHSNHDSSSTGLRHQRLARAAQAASDQAPSGHHWSLRQLPGSSLDPNANRVERRNTARRATRSRRAASSDPSPLSVGSLTAAEGCTKFYHVKPNDSCYSAIATARTHLSLEAFYAMNPQVDNDCYNLWTGYYYCVEKNGKKTSKSKTTSKKVKVAAAAVNKTTTSATKAVATPSLAESQDAADGDCEADDVNQGSSSSSSSPKQRATPAAVKPAVKPKTTTTTTTTENKPTPQPTPKKAEGANAQAYVQGGSNQKGDNSGNSSPSLSATTTTTTTTPPSQSTPTGGSSSSSSGLLQSLGISGFLGTNANAIASWFHTNSGQDSTNGNSWCYNKYTDSMPGFAADVNTMLANFEYSNIKAGEAYCGLEAEFTTPDGKTALLYLMDGFDSKWVRTPSSVDVIYGAFQKLRGYTTDDKNDVVTGVTWRWTGNKNSAYAFNGGNTAYSKE